MAVEGKPPFGAEQKPDGHAAPRRVRRFGTADPQRAVDAGAADHDVGRREPPPEHERHREHVARPAPPRRREPRHQFPHGRDHPRPAANAARARPGRAARYPGLRRRPAGPPPAECRPPCAGRPRRPRPRRRHRAATETRAARGCPSPPSPWCWRSASSSRSCCSARRGAATTTPRAARRRARARPPRRRAAGRQARRAGRRARRARGVRPRQHRPRHRRTPGRPTDQELAAAVNKYFSYIPGNLDAGRAHLTPHFQQTRAGGRRATTATGRPCVASTSATPSATPRHRDGHADRPLHRRPCRHPAHGVHLRPPERRAQDRPRELSQGPFRTFLRRSSTARR